MKIKDLKVESKISFVMKQIDACFYILEEQNNKYDTVYFGFVQVYNYRAWHYFTKSQIDYISKYFKTKKIKQTKTISDLVGENNLKGLPAPFKKVKEEKVYFNTAIFFNFFNKEYQERIKTKDSGSIDYYFKTRKEFLLKIKKHPIVNEIFSDREVVIFGEKRNFSPYQVMSEAYLNERELQLLQNFESKKELINHLIPSGLRDKKVLFKYIQEHLLYRQGNQYNSSFGLNVDFIGTCLLINEIIGKEKINFSFYKDFIHALYRRPACFRSERTHYKLKGIPQRDALVKLVKHLSGSNPTKNLKIIKNWKLYSGSYHHVVESIEKIKKIYPLDLSKHKDPFWAYSFYSKKYTKKYVPNIVLKNDLVPTKIDFVEISPVNTLKDLISIGVKLHNCAGNIETLFYYRTSVLFTVKVNQKIYLGSIRHKKLTQLKGWKNSAPSQEVFEIAKDYVLSNGYADRAESFEKACIQKY